VATSKPTASRELAALIKKNVLEKIGITGKGTYYILKSKGLQTAQRAQKGLTNGS